MAWSTEDPLPTYDETLLVQPPRTVADITSLLNHYKPDPAATARLLAEADAPPPITEDRNTLFRFYWMRGLAARKVGRINQEITDLRQAAEYGQRGTADYVRMLRNLASAETSGGNLLNGLRVAEESWKQTPKNQLGQALAAEQLMTYQYTLLGDFDSANRLLRETEGTFTLLQRSKKWEELGKNWISNVERARGEVYKAEGRLAEAENAYRKALNTNKLFLEAGEQGKLDEERLLIHQSALFFREGLERSLASLLLAAGKTVEAEVYARQALKHSLERVGRATSDTAQSLLALARIISEQGRHAEAVLLAKESLRSYQMSGAAPESLPVANARRALASALVAQGKYKEAIETFKQMHEGLKKDSALLGMIKTGDLDWALAMLRTGDQPGAEKMTKSMLDDSVQKLGDKATRTAEIRAFYAMALASRGASAEARAMFEASVPELIEQARSDAEAETGTLKRHQRLITVLESYLKLLSDSDRPGIYLTGTAANESFRIADIARSSSVQRALTASAARVSISDPKLAVLARHEQDAQRRISALSELLSQLLSAPPEQQVPAIQSRIRENISQLKRERENARQEIAARFPDYANLVDPKPATVAQTAKVLKPGEVLLAFYFGEEAGYVWALKADGHVAFSRVPMTRAELKKDVQNLRRALDTEAASIADIPAFDLNMAYQLYTRLLQPVQPVWQGAKTLLAVPHAELGQLPLALLPTEPITQPGKSAIPFASYRDVPWLIRKAAIAQLPSITALASLRRLPPGDPSRRPFIGFGDPFFSKVQAQEAGVNPAAATMATRSMVHRRSAPQTAQVDSAGLAQLPRLPDTNDEIREIAKVLGADPAHDIYLQTRATVKSVQDSDLASRRVVMFATHGLIPGDLDGLTQPALALTSPEVTADAGDGLLTMDKVLSLKLNADWVVLSACNTASGEGAGSEAVSGLGRAFFYAGARALLVSNWPVETVAARLLMTDLFRRQSTDTSLAKPEALRQSMLSLLNGPGMVDSKTGKSVYAHAHPLFWAPFVIVGD